MLIAKMYTDPNEIDLILKVYVNLTEIDSIYIQNTGEINTKGATKYLIRKPATDIPIWHTRKKGYRPLLLKALKVIKGAV